MQSLKQKDMTIKEYTKEFYRLDINSWHVDDDVEKIAKYINGSLVQNIYIYILLNKLLKIVDMWLILIRWPMVVYCRTFISQPNLWLNHFNHWFSHLLFLLGSLYGSLFGNFGNLFSSIFGNFLGSIFGSIYGTILGNTFGSLFNH